MKRFTSAMLVPAALAVFAHPATAADKAAQNPLDGEWVAESVVRNGTTADVKVRMAFSGKTVTARVRDEDGDKYTQKYIVKLDATVTPNQIDFTEKKDDEDRIQTYRGIYRFKGDKLTLCVQNEADRPRPTEFKSTEDDGRVLAVFKRAKEEAKNKTKDKGGAKD